MIAFEIRFDLFHLSKFELSVLFFLLQGLVEVFSCLPGLYPFELVFRRPKFFLRLGDSERCAWLLGWVGWLV